MAILTDALVESYAGPKKLLRVDGRVVVTIGWRREVEDFLPAAWTAQALGWGHQIVAESRDKAALVAYCQKRFPDCEIQYEGRG